ncbi:MAG: YihA family ribosome biogenesis GTP-binding protein [Parcubacteria group bacterium]|nr:YihA family ribosome biogenesis GTP-binding protein [Parcubacteria group bacterium]
MKIESVKFVKGIRGTDPILNDSKPAIAFVGRSNVGKSSVINALLGRKGVAKSSSTPGKTKEINFFLVNDKLPDSFFVVDLPGYGYAKVSDKEKEKLVKLILWYLFESGSLLKLVFLIIDANVGPTNKDTEMMRALAENAVPFAVIGNKIDKINKSIRAREIKKLADACAPALFIPFSAKEKTGISDVLQKIT